VILKRLPPHPPRYAEEDVAQRHEAALAKQAPREKRRRRSWDEWLSASPVAIVGLVLFVAWMVATAFIPCSSTDPFYVCGMW
jgi:hypothetical protein